MYRAARTFLVAAALGMLLVAVPEGVGRVANPCAQVERSPGSPWRRTRDGWERVAWLADEARVAAPKMHPLTLAIFQVLAACGALAVRPRCRPNTVSLLQHHNPVPTLASAVREGSATPS